MTIQLAVFDMVGTTVQSGDEMPSAFREAFLSVGLELSDEAITNIRGLSKSDAISDLMSSLGVADSDRPEMSRVVYERFQENLWRAYRAEARAIPESEGVFHFLMETGVQVVVATGLDQTSANLLFQGLGWDALGLTGLICGDDVVQGRPAPDLIRAAMSLAEVSDPKAVLVVGDTTSDLEASQAAGVGLSVAVLTGAHSRERLQEHPHSAILENVGGLPAWLAEVGALDGPEGSAL